MKRNLLCTTLLVLVLTVLFAACAYAADVRPLEISPDELDLNNGKFCLTVRDEEMLYEDEPFFTAELYLEDRYDGEQIKALAPGDTVEMNGVVFTVQEIDIQEYEDEPGYAEYEICPAEEYFGYLVFVPLEDGTYSALIDDWIPVSRVREVKVTLPLADRFTYISISGGEEDEPASADAFLEELDMFGGFNAYNTTCVMEDGALVSVTHSSYPWGPEEYWPGEEDDLSGDSDDSDDSSEPDVLADSDAFSDDGASADSGASASDEIPVWKFFHAASAEQLETAVILGYTLDCEAGPVPYEMPEEEAEELRTLAMYGVITGKKSDEMVTGGTWIYSFETPDGEYIMSVELYKGLLVGSDGMYSYEVRQDGNQ